MVTMPTTLQPLRVRKRFTVQEGSGACQMLPQSYCRPADRFIEVEKCWKRKECSFDRLPSPTPQKSIGWCMLIRKYELPGPPLAEPWKTFKSNSKRTKTTMG